MVASFGPSAPASGTHKYPWRQPNESMSLSLLSPTHANPSSSSSAQATMLHRAVAMGKLVGAAGRSPGWEDLPRDLLESVLGRLAVPDRLRFTAVCTAWQLAAVDAPRVQPAVPSPWLMLPFNPTARRRRQSSSDADGKLLEARFLSLTDGRAYAIPQPAPAISDRLCVGSSDGWLVTADATSELHLLNPLTGTQIALPSVSTLPFVRASRDADGRVVSYSIRCCFADDGDDGGDDEVVVPPESFAPDRLRYELYEKAILVSPPRKICQTPVPSGSWGGYAVMLICQPLFRLAVARAGDKKWTLLDTPSRWWVDAVRAGSATDGPRQAVYTMDTVGRVEAWDMDVTTPDTVASTQKPSTAVAPPCPCGCSGRRYLVELSPGHLLQVHRIRDAAHARYSWEPRPERVEYTTVKAELFECTAGTDRWAPVDSKDGTGILGGRALFLGKNASMCVPGDCCPEVKGNCVYFTDDGPWSHERCHEVAQDVGVLDLADGRYRPQVGAGRDLIWKWPPPVWVFPSWAN